MNFNKEKCDRELHRRFQTALKELQNLSTQMNCPHNQGWTDPSYWNDGTPECMVCGVAMDGRS